MRKRTTLVILVIGQTMITLGCGGGGDPDASGDSGNTMPDARIDAALDDAEMADASAMDSAATDATGLDVMPDADGTPPESLPGELDGLTLTSIFEDNFDAHDDFENPEERYFCSAPDCSVPLSGWTSLSVGERFHPVDDNNPSLEANFQLSAEQARGGTGKALKLYDESFGNSGQWGSDILLSKKLDQGYDDLYVEFWVKFQPGYRWHLLEEGHGQNSAKMMRISHRQEGRFSSTYGANGSHGPMSLMNIIPQITRGENEITRLYGNRRCAPQTTNYFCSDEGSGRIIGGINDNASWAESFGDGEWHKIAMRMKLNSAPGITDGSLMVWYDDQLLGESPTIDWLGTDTTEPRLLNHVTISGNMHNYPEPEANQFEQWYALDDVRVFSVQ